MLLSRLSVGLTLAIFLVRAEVTASACSSENCEACSSSIECDDTHECESTDDLNGFRCLSRMNGTGSSCTESEVDRCHQDCEEGYQGPSSEGTDERERCYEDCDYKCGVGGGGGELGPAALLGVVAF